jgi:hypothetical protein
MDIKHLIYQYEKNPICYQKNYKCDAQYKILKVPRYVKKSLEVECFLLVKTLSSVANLFSPSELSRINNYIYHYIYYWNEMNKQKPTRHVSIMQTFYIYRNDGV